MKAIFGIIFVIVCVFGGFIISGGQLLALWHPPELMIILGGATGAFIIANPGSVLKASAGGLAGIFKGSKYKKATYLDLLSLMHNLFGKARKEGLMALETDIEEPHESEIFNQFPSIAKNHHVTEFICDYLRLMVGGNMNAIELESLMDVELETHHHEAAAGPTAVTTMSDGLPGFGIVAAVMGVVITMGFISEPPEVLGQKVGAALVGTFLGILFAYGFVGPMAKAMEGRSEEDAMLFGCAKTCILATLNGYTPQIAIEFGRKVLGSTVRPSFTELEEHIKGQK